MAQIAFTLRGMRCAACGNIVTTAVQQVPGVSQCDVSFGAAQAMVTYDPQRVSWQAIQQAIAQAGYGAEPLVNTDLLAEATAEDNAQAVTMQELQHRLFLAGGATLVLVVGSLPMMLGVSIPWLPMWLHHPWLQLALTTPIQFWSGESFYGGRGKHCATAAPPWIPSWPWEPVLPIFTRSDVGGLKPLRFSEGIQPTQGALALSMC
jgi:Cu+-exporting ATPase